VAQPTVHLANFCDSADRCLHGIDAACLIISTADAQASVLAQGRPWDWLSPARRALAPCMLAVLQRVHDHGILHGDLHEGNILMVARDSVFLLDLGACDLEPNDWDLAAERRDFAHLLSLRRQMRRPPCVGG